MITNILSEEYIEQVRNMYRHRRLAVALAALSVVGLFGAIALIPPYVLLKVKEEGAAKQLAIVTAANAQQLGGNADLIISNVNTRAQFLLSPDISALTSDGFIEKILSYKTSVIALTGFFYDGLDPNDKDKETLVYRVRGIAKNREALASFIESLRADSFFTRVDVPISQFVRERDVNFSIILTARLTR